LGNKQSLFCTQGEKEKGSAVFEVVHTLTDWYDGPRRGIANYHGQPHLFESEWGDGEYLDADTFLLMPIDPDTFSLALEDWAIWRRWESLDPSEPPANSGARESIPPDYSSPTNSKLRAVVGASGGQFNFDVKSK